MAGARGKRWHHPLAEFWVYDVLFDKPAHQLCKEAEIHRVPVTCQVCELEVLFHVCVREYVTDLRSTRG